MIFSMDNALDTRNRQRNWLLMAWFVGWATWMEWTEGQWKLILEGVFAGERKKRIGTGIGNDGIGPDLSLGDGGGGGFTNKYIILPVFLTATTQKPRDPSRFSRFRHFFPGSPWQKLLENRKSTEISEILRSFRHKNHARIAIFMSKGMLINH